tara:strand:- start:2841 stop:3407 length:567 start_codon:yes stop_codon:yes gene_type:complete
MCGRFTLFDKTSFDFEMGIDFKPNFNVSPGSMVYIIREDKMIVKIKWSLIPFWSEKISIINARSETLDSKTSFKKVDRCIFIANGFFEWKRENSTKIPYYHTFKQRNMFMGGIYNSTGACIVTRESYPKLAKIHHRQPVLLNLDDFDSWLNNSHDYQCSFSEKLIIYPVTKKVNLPSNNSSDNISKVD